MKRLLVVMALVALLASVAFASTHDFGAFTVDVLDGWTASQEGPTAVIIKNDNTASLSITFTETEGASLGDIANAFVEEFKKTFTSVSAPEKDADGDYSFSMVNGNGVESKALLTGDEKHYCLFVMTGVDAAGDEISKMLGSVKDK